MNESHTPRPKFDTLFADPRHYRGDCRLMRTAIRRGWLDDVPQADRDAMLDRFDRANAERDAAGYATLGGRVRAIFARAGAIIEAVGADQRGELRALRYSWAGEPTGRTTGRPRERWHVGDCRNRIDAHAIRRRVKAAGDDLRTLRAIVVRPADEPHGAGERIALAVIADARCGVRVWLVCPRCGTRRVYLYPTARGVTCRTCAGIGYR